MNIFGALFITAASVALGWKRAKELRKHLCLLGSIIDFLNIINCEITSFRTPLNEVFYRLSSAQENEISDFAKYIYEKLSIDVQSDFSEAWAEGTEKYLGTLSADSKASLKRLGDYLGRYDSMLQSNAVMRCISELEHEYTLKKDKQKDNERLCLALWSSAGMVVSLVLI